MPEHRSTLDVALATWIYHLHVAGIDADDASLVESCSAVDAATDDATGDVAGEALVARVAELLDGDDVAGLAARLFGARAAGSMGEGSRDERVQRIRKYQFERNLPWLARIWERNGDTVAPTWLLVERVTDEVAAMDPNPWDDIDEERRIPVSDFHVLWELDACTSVSIQ